MEYIGYRKIQGAAVQTGLGDLEMMVKSKRARSKRTGFFRAPPHRSTGCISKLRSSFRGLRFRLRASRWPISPFISLHSCTTRVWELRGWWCIRLFSRLSYTSATSPFSLDTHCPLPSLWGAPEAFDSMAPHALSH
jgi:hypothetical protein